MTRSPNIATIRGKEGEISKTKQTNKQQQKYDRKDMSPENRHR